LQKSTSDHHQHAITVDALESELNTVKQQFNAYKSTMYNDQHRLMNQSSDNSTLDTLRLELNRITCERDELQLANQHLTDRLKHSADEATLMRERLDDNEGTIADLMTQSNECRRLISELQESLAEKDAQLQNFEADPLAKKGNSMFHEVRIYFAETQFNFQTYIE
jgi:chromosome segregation ATPase